MRKTALPLTISAAETTPVSAASDGLGLSQISLSQLSRFADGWLLDGEIRQHSAATLSFRRLMTEKLLWFLREHGHETCGRMELRAFLAYLSTGHTAEGGRWGNAQQTRPARPSTVKTYHSHLRTFFRWLIAEGVLTTSPMETIAAPISRSDQIQPFTDKQIDSLLSAARRSRHARRDEAIVAFLLDTGVRASELCSLRLSDMDMTARSCTVVGKGNKRRSIYFGRTTAKALWNYLREEEREKEAPIFLSDRGTRAGEPLTRSGLGQLVERLGEAAHIEVTRCSPHTFRHTFSVNFLRNGGQVFALMQMLGHTNLQMTNRYVALAQGDLANQHRQFSPLDHMKGRA